MLSKKQGNLIVAASTMIALGATFVAPPASAVALTFLTVFAASALALSFLTAIANHLPTMPSSNRSPFVHTHDIEMTRRNLRKTAYRAAPAPDRVEVHHFHESQPAAVIHSRRNAQKVVATPVATKGVVRTTAAGTEIPVHATRVQRHVTTGAVAPAVTQPKETAARTTIPANATQVRRVVEQRTAPVEERAKGESTLSSRVIIRQRPSSAQQAAQPQSLERAQPAAQTEAPASKLSGKVVIKPR